MSHATYAFLINLDSDDDTEIAGMATGEIESWAERRCDDNNWYQEEAVVLQDGRFVSLCAKGDLRGRDWMGQKLEEVPQEQRWEWARLFALQCVATDMEIGGRASFSIMPEAPREDPYWVNFDLLKARILEEIPPRLAALWSKGSLAAADAFDMDLYRRTKWSRQFGMFVEAMSYGTDHAPFGDGSASPYEYRAFDLVSDSNLPMAIVFVDIHT